MEEVSEVSYITLEHYLDRFAELLVEIGDEAAAIRVLAIESEPAAVVSFIADILQGNIDKTADKVYAAYALNETDYASVQKTVDYIIQKYKDRKLPILSGYIPHVDFMNDIQEED